MRRKQLFALALAGALTFSLTPTSLLADDMSDAPAVAASAEAGAEEAAQEQPAQQETPVAEPVAEVVADTPAPEVPTEAPTEAPTQAPTEAPTEAPTQAPTEAPVVSDEVDEDALLEVEETPAAPTEAPVATATTAPTATPTVAPTDSPTPTPEESKTKVVTNEAELIAAIAEADEIETAIIEIANDIELSQTVIIPAHKKICLVTMASAAEISRAVGFKDDMFSVSGTLSFLKANKTDDINETGGTLTIDGGLIDETATGSIVHVDTDAIFAIDDSAELTGNRTTAKGGAIYSDGLVLLLGGSIWGNSAEDGGAIFANNLVSIEKSADATGNYASDGATKNNIALAGPATLVVDGAITIGRAGVHAVEPTEGKVLVQLSETAAAETTLAEALNSIELDDDSEYKLNATGSLVAEAEDEAPTPTPTQVPSITPELGRVSGPEWIDENTASITCTSDMDGWYYAAAARETDEVPEFEVNEDGIPVKAGEDFTVTVTVPEDDDDYCIYVLIKGENYTLSSKKKAPLDSTTRPGHEAQTEDEAEAEAVSTEAEGIEETETEVTEEENTEETEAEETEEENAEETEEETTEETEDEEEVSEEEGEKDPEAVGDPEESTTPETVTISSPEFTDTKIALKKDREVPFTLVLGETEEGSGWTLEDIDIGSFKVTDKDGNKIDDITVKAVNRKEGKYNLIPSKDITGTIEGSTGSATTPDYSISFGFTKEGAEGEDPKTATASVKFTRSDYTLANEDDIKINTGLDGAYYFFPGYAHEFTVTGVGPQKGENVGDTRLVPKAVKLAGNTEEIIPLDKTNINILKKTGRVYSKNGISTAKENRLYLQYYLLEWNGSTWETQSIPYKTFTVKSLAYSGDKNAWLGKESAKVVDVGESKTYTFKMSKIPEEVTWRTEDKGIVEVVDFKEGVADASGEIEYTITFKGLKGGTEDVDVYFVQNGTEYCLKHYIVNVYQPVFLAKGEEFIDDEFDVKNLTETVNYDYATPKESIKVTPSSGKITIKGVEDITKGFVKVAIQDKDTEEFLKFYHVYGVSSVSTEITLNTVNNKTWKRDFSRVSENEVKASSKDDSIATVETKQTQSSSGKYNIHLEITAKKAGETVVTYNDKGKDGEHRYTINVVVKDTTTVDTVPVSISVVNGTYGKYVDTLTGVDSTSEITWDPSVPSIAEVTYDAATATVTIVGLKAGSTTISLFKDGELFKKYSVTVPEKGEPTRDPVSPSYKTGYVTVKIGTTEYGTANDGGTVTIDPYTLGASILLEPHGAKPDVTSFVQGDVRYEPYCYAIVSDEKLTPRARGNWYYTYNGSADSGYLRFRVYYLRQTYNGSTDRWEPALSSVSWETVREANYYTSHTIKLNIPANAKDSSSRTSGTTGSSGTTYSSGGSTTSSSSGSGSSSRRTTTTPAVHSPTVTGGASGSTQVGNARTGDSAPVGTMLLLGMMSLLTGGYVVSRKRKDDYDI